jgi:hypothetical protein
MSNGLLSVSYKPYRSSQHRNNQRRSNQHHSNQHRNKRRCRSRKNLPLYCLHSQMWFAPNPTKGRQPAAWKAKMYALWYLQKNEKVEL